MAKKKKAAKKAANKKPSKKGNLYKRGNSGFGKSPRPKRDPEDWD